LVIVVLLLIGAAPRPPTPLSRSRPAVLDTRQRETGTLRVRLLGPYRWWCPRPTGIDLGNHLSRRNVIVNRYESTIAR
jgi:hypothetical protein